MRRDFCRRSLMKRFFRILRNCLVALSLAICLASLAFWIRGWHYNESLHLIWISKPDAQARSTGGAINFSSLTSQLHLTLQHFTHADAASHSATKPLFAGFRYIVFSNPRMQGRSGMKPFFFKRYSSKADNIR